jgi:TonB-linked SusC/RagA family outer membrane protein
MKRKLLLLCLFLVFGAVLHVAAQDKTVTGRVTSADDGTALPGVNVVVKGSSSGTVTDAQGRYSISVGDNATLVYSFVGLTTQEIPVANQSTIDVQLASDVRQLSEVVVTALGIEREQKSLGYSVQEIQGETVARVKDANVLNSLQGRIAGVQVQGNPGALGGSSRVLIRGARSVAGENQPLIVIDGVPLDNSNFNDTDTQRGAGGVDYGNAAQFINPEDIETYSVLKGPNAAALYGNRAANGAIVITTKKGRARKGLGVNVSSDIQFQDLLVLPDYQNEYGGGAGPFSRNAQGQDVVRFAVDESWGPRLDGRPVRQWYSYDPTIPEFFGQPTPWVAQPDNVRDFYNTGLQNTNSISLNGGNEKGTFRLGYTNLNARGIMPNSTLGRHTISFNGGLNLTEKLKTSIGVNYVSNEAVGRPVQGYDGVIVQFNQFGQRQMETDLLDRYWITPSGEQRTWNRRSANDPFPQYADNPYWIRRKNFQSDQTQRVFGNVTLSYEFIPGLTLTGRVLNDYYLDRREERIANGSVAQSEYNEELREVQEINSDLILNFNRELGPLFSLNALVGGNIRKNRYLRNIGTTVGGLSVPDFFNLENSAERPLIEDRLERRRINSVFGQASIGFRDMIFLEGTLRNDWSSTLPAGNNSFLYPSINASFVVSEIGPLKNNNVLSFAKVRAGFAQVGNDTDPYRTVLTYQPRANFGASPSYRVPLTRNNLNLKPEQTNSFEVGLETRFLQDRLTFDAAYYTSATTDQIFEVPISGASGYTAQIINAGKVTNKGIELSLNATPVQTTNLTWTVGANWARNRNKLVELTEGITNYRLANGPFGASINARVGEPLGTIVGIDYVYHEGRKVVDENGVYAFSAGQVPLGSVLADWTGGFNTGLTWKGVSLNALLTGQMGGKLYSLSSLFGKYSGMMQETTDDNIRQLWMIADGVKENADGSFSENDIEVRPQDFFSSMFGHGAAFVYDASFIKLRELSLGYSLPQSLLGKTPFSTVTVSVIGRNLALLYSKVPHVDPESATAGSGNIQGYEGGALPSLRSYGFSVNIGL